jgi:hypothetical protein
MIVGYEGPTNADTALATVGSFFENQFANDPRLAREMVDAFGNFDPVRPAIERIFQVERILPKLIAAIDTNQVSLVQGWGPPEDATGERHYGPGLRRLPFMYAQRMELTSPLEKIVYRVLSSTYKVLRTSGWSLVAAWGELDPVSRVRFGDADEIDEHRNARLLDPLRLAIAADRHA